MPQRFTFHLIPHTHWDREWYLPRAGFQARLAPLGEALVELLAADPAAAFVCDGQTVLLEDLRQVAPRAYERLLEAGTAGRLDVGPWYVLADEQIPSGESHLRNLLLGAADARRFGARMDVLYSPDAFGHPGAFPMLAREFGMRFGALWRGLGRPEGRESDLWRWRSVDGSEILLYHLPPSGYEIGADLLEPSRDLPATWAAMRDGLLARAATAHVAIFVGADHHAPPASLATLRDRLRAIEPDHAFRIGTLSEFFAAVEPVARDLPVIRGEQRWSYGYTWTLQGVHATRARMKRRHANVELRWQRKVEVLAALARLHHGVDRRPLLATGWRALVESQFHDTIGGCASDLVNREQLVRLQSVAATGNELIRESLAVLTGHDADRARSEPAAATPSLVLWNPVPRPRAGVVIAPVTFFRGDVLVGPPSGRHPRTQGAPTPFALVDEAGRIVPTQLLRTERALERLDAARHYPDQDIVDRAYVAFEAPAIGGGAFRILATEPRAHLSEAGGVAVTPRSLANDFVSVEVSSSGQLTLIDKRTGARFKDLLHYVDERDDGDSYSPAIAPGSEREARSEVSVTVLAAGPLVGALVVQWTTRAATGGPLALRQVLSLHADSPVLRVRVEIDNQASDHRLRVRLPAGGHGESVAGTAFGSVRREAFVGDPRAFPAEHPVATAPAQRFVATGAAAAGLVVLQPGFFEYEATPRGMLYLTLLRGVGQLSKSDLVTRPGHAGWPLPTPEAQEHGSHLIEFGIAPLGPGEPRGSARLEALWEDLFLPIEGRFARDFTGSMERLVPVGVELDGEGLIASAIKPSEDGTAIVLRCYNTAEHDVAGAWRFRAEIGGATLVRADETALDKLEVDNGTRVPFVARPGALVSVRVVP